MSDYPRAELLVLRPVGGISLAMVGLGAAGIEEGMSGHG